MRGHVHVFLSMGNSSRLGYA